MNLNSYDAGWKASGVSTILHKLTDEKMKFSKRIFEEIFFKV